MEFPNNKIKINKNNKLQIKNNLLPTSLQENQDSNVVIKLSHLNPISESKSKSILKKIPLNLNKLKQKHFNTLKKHRRKITRKKRRKLIGQYPILKLFWNCTSKMKLMRIFNQLNKIWKNFVTFYLERCYIIHLSIRQLKDVSELMRYRQNLYDSLKDPQLLLNRVHFKNNLIKNFCKGLSNFFVTFYEELISEKMIPEVNSFEI